MNLVYTKQFSSDTIGMTSSTLCLIHCMLTPFVFIAQACTTTCCTSAPGWWKAIDLLFLIVSFIAVYFSAKTTSKKWMRIAFYSVFIVFTVLIANEYFTFYRLTRYPMYIVAGILTSLHFYNRKYSSCSNNCCDNK